MMIRTVETRKEKEETLLPMPAQKTQMRRTSIHLPSKWTLVNNRMWKLVCYYDMSMFHKLDESFKPDKHYIELANGERSINVALKRGTANMKFVDSKGECADIVLINALYVPHFHIAYFQFKLPLIKEPVYLFNQTMPNFH